jgi:nicotinamide-nucleotide amidase
VFTVGGLGPTADDRTLEGVALGLGAPLELHPEAERMVAEKYEAFYASGHVPFPEMNESRRKMARLPAGAEPIVNPIGGAPGVLCRAGHTRVVSLPGVPGELKAIVDGPLAPLLSEVFGVAHYEERSVTVDLQDESAIADVLRRVEAAHPQVYVKSRAKVIGSVRALLVTVSARAESAAEVDGLLEAVTEHLSADVRAAGYAVHRTTVPPDDRPS